MLSLTLFILRNRFFFAGIVVVWIIISILGGLNFRISYEPPELLPSKSSVYISNLKIRKIFGEGNRLIFVAIPEDFLRSKETYNSFFKIIRELKKIEGVETVISLASLPVLVKDTIHEKFDLEILPDENTDYVSEEFLDSLKTLTSKLLIYKDLLYNSKNHSLIIISINEEILNSPKRQDVINKIEKITHKIADIMDSGNVFIAGFPYLRDFLTQMLKKEAVKYSIAAILLCTIIVSLIYKGFIVVIFATLLLGTVVISGIGLLGILEIPANYLTGIIPSLVSIISIPNSIFLFSYLIEEIKRGRRGYHAICLSMEKSANDIIWTNLTTAASFASFLVGTGKTFKEFAIVSTLLCLILMVLSLIIFPIFISFFRSSRISMRKSIEDTFRKITVAMYSWTSNHFKVIIGGFMLLTIFCVIFILRIKPDARFSDEIPEDSRLFHSLVYFEKEFNGSLILDIVVDTKKPGKARLTSVLGRCDTFLGELLKYNGVGKVISPMDFIKYARMVYYDMDTLFWGLPSQYELPFLKKYAENLRFMAKKWGLQLIDSLNQFIRMPLKIKENPYRIQKILFDTIFKKVKEFQEETGYEVLVAGPSLIYFKSNEYMISNLIRSFIFTLIMIFIIVSIGFKSLLIGVNSIVLLIFPVVFLGGALGFLNIPIKPVVLAIFSISSGLGVDNIIHVLSRYSLELKTAHGNIQKALKKTISGAAPPAIMSFISLFCGFLVYSISSLSMVKIFGELMGITLAISLIISIFIFPALLSLLIYIKGRIRI